VNAGARFKIGTAAIKTPAEAHRYGEFQKAKVEESADAYRLDLGWIVFYPDHYRKGYGSGGRCNPWARDVCPTKTD
jgi:hypothetical protein